MRSQSDVIAVVILVFVTLAIGMILFAYSVSQQSWIAGERARVVYLSEVSSSIDFVTVYSSVSNNTACLILEVINIGVETHYITIAVASGVVSETLVSIDTGARVVLSELKSRDGFLEIPTCPSSIEPSYWIDISTVMTGRGYALSDVGAPLYMAPARSLLLEPGASRTLYIEAPRGAISVIAVAYITDTPYLASSRIYTIG